MKLLSSSIQLWKYIKINTVLINMLGLVYLIECCVLRKRYGIRDAE